ncbi:MAG: glycosyltransferase family 9 protein [Candidatus Omnitrophica bacterium]|nr:glycosyltransferase family 9 protein [Candidatus Omnitrophota bacterium]
MKIELMRHIDYFVGRPLCFLLSIANFFLGLFDFNKKRVPAYKKILFVKLSEMGSIILAHPLISRAAADYPEAKIFFLTFQKNKYIFDLLKSLPQENILTIRESPFPLFILDSLKAVARLRREKIDLAFDLELFSRCTAILTYLSAAKKRVGFFRYDFEGLYRGGLLTHKVQYNPLIHTAKSFMSLWEVINAPCKKSPELSKKIEESRLQIPKVEVDDKARQRMKERLRGFGIDDNSKVFLINPGEGRLPLREWPLENYIKVANRILQDEKNFLVVAGMEDYSNKKDLFISSLSSKRCVDLVNKTTLEELLVLFDIARALIANDCGLAHLASLTGVKKFIFFGPESPQLYLPLGGNSCVFYSHMPCSPCFSALNHRKSSCRDNKCLKAISCEEVIYTLEESVL